MVRKKKVTPLYKRIRKTWAINPRTRVKEDVAPIEDMPCERCGNQDPDVCYGCQFG